MHACLLGVAMTWASKNRLVQTWLVCAQTVTYSNKLKPTITLYNYDHLRVCHFPEKTAYTKYNSYSCNSRDHHAK